VAAFDCYAQHAANKCGPSGYLYVAGMTLPTILTIFSTAAFFVLERLLPGRPLPHVSGWYSRALLVNFAQLGITLSTARLWIAIFGPRSLFSLAAWDNPLLEGFARWFIGTFMFYWWHIL